MSDVYSYCQSPFDQSEGSSSGLSILPTVHNVWDVPNITRFDRLHIDVLYGHTIYATKEVKLGKQVIMAPGMQMTVRVTPFTRELGFRDQCIDPKVEHCTGEDICREWNRNLMLHFVPRGW